MSYKITLVLIISIFRKTNVHLNEQMRFLNTIVLRKVSENKKRSEYSERNLVDNLLLDRLFALLIGDAAGRFACGLAGGLAFAAAAVFLAVA
jgi:hypothetical protein